MPQSSLPTLQGSNSTDFVLTTDGDLVVGPTGDLELVKGLPVLQQEIAFRLKTKLGNYAYQPNCGTRLEELIGKANSQATANIGEEYIREALTHDGLLLDNTIEILSWPDGDDTIVYAIMIDLSSYGYPTEQYLSLQITLDLKEGLIF